ncbi:MAG: hypothetical protein ACI9HK_001907 [Pirellulaceae bacterium]
MRKNRAAAASLTALLVPFFFSAVCCADARTWVDNTGKFRIEAELVKIEGADVVLKTTAGREIRVPIDKLSPKDRAFLTARKSPPGNVPPGNVPPGNVPPGNVPPGNVPPGNVPPGNVNSVNVNSEPNGLVYANPGMFQMRIGAEVTAQNGGCGDLICTFPYPKEWPEQTVKIIHEDVSSTVRGISKKVIGDGVVQYEFRVPRLTSGQKAHVILTIEVIRKHILPPPRPLELSIPASVKSEMDIYLKESPFIETRHTSVKKAAANLPILPNDPAWKQIESIYNWTWDAVKPSGTKPLKGALDALKSGTGDCEERTSLFVAMCRLNKIPARCVWIPGHTYPEFYLEDAQRNGHWIPCESLGAKNFGTMPTYSLILQKGDNFRMAQKRGPQRYVSATLTGKLGPRDGQPVLKEIREPVDPADSNTDG